MKSLFALPLLALILIAGCAQPSGGIPGPVTDKYDELALEYSEGLGAILNDCMKGSQKHYIVVGSGGFSGVTFIYDAQGKLLQNYSWDDMVEPGETPPPFDSEEYTCKVVRESKKP